MLITIAPIATPKVVKVNRLSLRSSNIFITVMDEIKIPTLPRIILIMGKM